MAPAIHRKVWFTNIFNHKPLHYRKECLKPQSEADNRISDSESTRGVAVARRVKYRKKIEVKIIECSNNAKNHLITFWSSSPGIK